MRVKVALDNKRAVATALYHCRSFPMYRMGGAAHRSVKFIPGEKFSSPLFFFFFVLVCVAIYGRDDKVPGRVRDLFNFGKVYI